MAASEVTDGPVLSLMNKRLRALRKKYNRILQMEEAIAQGKPINKEQEDVLRSKPALVALIDEYEKLRQPLSSALQEELDLALQHHQVSASPPVVDVEAKDDKDRKDDDGEPQKARPDSDDAVVEDLLKLLYFGSLFDVKPQSDFTSTMLTRMHERGCCLTYDYVTDDATDLLGERDLDMISMLGNLLVSRPIHSSFSHQSALRSCVEHAKLWLANSDLPIEAGASVTYAGLRERLNKILASDYLITTPEMRAPVEVAAAAGKYAPCQVLVHDSAGPSPPSPVQKEGAFAHYQQKDEEIANFVGQESSADPTGSVEELSKDEPDIPSTADAFPVQQEQIEQTEVEEQNQRVVESKEQQYIPRRTYQNQRGGGRAGGGGGRRGFANGRGGRSSRGGGYQNGRNQYYDQPGNYYPRNNYNTWGRGSRGAGGHSYNNHGSAAHGSHSMVDVELGS